MFKFLKTLKHFQYTVTEESHMKSSKDMYQVLKNVLDVYIFLPNTLFIIRLNLIDFILIFLRNLWMDPF